MGVLIIAEAGVNHNGDIKIAEKMIEEAKKAGADIVKFQTFDSKCLASKKAELADYQKKNLGIAESQEKMLESLMLRRDDFFYLASFCEKIGIGFLSTPFDIGSVSFLNDLQDKWKIPSGEITNFPYLVKIAATGKDVYMSTGMSTLEEVNEAISVLRNNGCGDITLLHCTTNYPTPMKEVNLRAMITLKSHFGVDVGYSDHTEGIEVPIAAVAMGATVIEKHFTLDRNMKGPDHKASLEPNELSQMIKAIRNVEIAMGTGRKTPTPSEQSNMSIVRKSIFAKKKIKADEVLSEENITTKRPGTGISPMRWNDILGTKAVRDFEEDEMIEV